MEEKKFWGLSRSAGARTGLVVRIGLVLLAVVGSVMLAWTLVGSHQGARAAGVNEYQTTQAPWGVAFDKSGHIWVAEPACDASPVCGTPPQGIIAEYTMSTGNKVNDFTSASATIFTPVFLVVDGSGNIWFTDPTHNAIGKLIPSSNTWTEWTAPTANAAPYDLVMDSSGNIWFTEIQAGKIGFFKPSNQTFVETATPTAGSSPYGITIAPNGTIWFTENAQPKIGSFTPSGTGTITIAEHVISTIPNPPTPHLITSDTQGNIWYSEGFAGQIGRYVPSSNTATNFSTSNGSCPSSAGTPTPPPSCPIHISGIAVDSSGMVWFDDSLGARVGFVNPASGVSTWVTLSRSDAHPHDGLAIDGSNNVWFTEQNGWKVGDVPAGSLGTGTPTPTVTGTAPITTPPGPVNKNWYFAEGRVGGGFKEYLTLDNPDPANSCPVNIQYLYTPDGGSATSKNVPVTVPAASRLTQSVNGDLNIQPTQTPAASLAAIVTVGGGACKGIVAERPMYFQWHGINSGSDVPGLTQKGTTWNFGDVPTGGGYTSYITILNPGGTAANVTATYYPNGQTPVTQTLQVPAGTRGTISPNGLGLPQHVAAVVTSDQPVVVERPAYFSNVNGGGNLGSISGGADVVGVQALANNWLFAEGYTGSGFQENLVVANLDLVANATASVVIKLEYTNGTTKSFNLAVPAKSQAIWNINTQAPNGGSPEVSADITSTGAKIVVERQMFFKYSHTVNGTTTTAKGGTDVIGQVGPAAHASYSFAEGYTNKGYNEWLLLQNPTANPETVYVTLVNSKGRTYTPPGYVVPANSRYNIDITAVVVQHMVKPGDNYQGYEVAMTVQTLNNSFFVAERPMYWNTAGSSFATQGGSDIFGYVGG